MTWTRAAVRGRLESAVDVLDRLWISLGPAGIRPSWPPIVRTTIESYGWHAANARPAPPQGREIDEMDEALGWLVWLDGRDQKVVWARLNGAPWWRIAQRFGRGEGAVRLWFSKAMDLIAFQLNGKADGAAAETSADRARRRA
jgi:hypothetical protein